MGKWSQPGADQYRYNDGVAPIYLPYTLSFRIINDANNVVAQEIHRKTFVAGCRVNIS